MPLSFRSTRSTSPIPAPGAAAGRADAGPTAEGDRAPGRPTGWRSVVRRLSADRGAVVGAVVVVLTAVVALAAPLITRTLGVDPYTYHLQALDPSGLPRGGFGGIGADHPFGVEPQTGRDLLAIVVEDGAR